MIEEEETKLFIRKHFGLRGNTKVYLNERDYKFSINLGESLIELDYPKQLIRDKKLKSIGI